MTALAALWRFDGVGASAGCARMLDAQAIYGPDGAVQADGGPIAMGRRLFRLTVEDDADRGPLRSACGTWLMTADIRIDNRDDLAAMLDVPSASLPGLSDPALLMRVIERWGTAGLAKVVGPSAVILWNDTARTLTLARDPMGERPLHYHRGDAFVAVASMPKGLHALPDVPYAADPTTAADFLALIPETGTESFFAGVARVLPGHLVTIAVDGTSSERFWDWPVDPLILPTDAEYIDAVRIAFDRAVKRRLRVAHGAIGTHLSGGLDSAGVAATAAGLLAPAPLYAFTAVPSVPCEVPRGTIADEGPLAALVAAMHPTIQHERLPSSHRSPLSLFDRHFHLFERPVLNPSNAVWTEAIADVARARGVRVLLTGQMGNLTISHTGLQHLPELLGRMRLPALVRLARAMARGGMRRRAVGAMTIGPFFPRGVWAWLERRFATSVPMTDYSAIRDDAILAADIDARAAARGLDLSGRPWRNGRTARLWALGRVDMGVYNKGMLAGWGLDVRDPTADRDLVALCLAIPERQFILEGVQRSLARRMFADRLPDAVVGERRRGFQAADWHVALTAARPAIAAELDGIDRSPVAARLIDTDRLRAALADWPEGGWHERDRIDRYELAMNRGLAAGHFLRRVARTN